MNYNKGIIHCTWGVKAQHPVGMIPTKDQKQIE